MSSDDIDDPKYWARHYADEYYERAKYYKKQADYYRGVRDSGGESPYSQDCGLSRSEYNQKISEMEDAARYQEQRGREVYEETLERHRREEQAKREEARRQEGQKKADRMLDDWFKKQ